MLQGGKEEKGNDNMSYKIQLNMFAFLRLINLHLRNCEMQLKQRDHLTYEYHNDSGHRLPCIPLWYVSDPPPAYFSGKKI